MGRGKANGEADTFQTSYYFIYFKGDSLQGWLKLQRQNLIIVNNFGGLYTFSQIEVITSSIVILRLSMI